MQTLALLMLLCCLLAGGQANRVYVHPFHLFAAENVSCEPLHTQTDPNLKHIPVAPLDIAVLAPDSRDALTQNGQNITERTAVLSELLNSLGLRMYQGLSSKQRSVNTVVSPVNTYGTLVTFNLGASKVTARLFQRLLGLGSDTDREDCVSLVDGHKVLKTLQGINSLVDDGPKDEITTQVWVFTRRNTKLSDDFVQGTQDFSDAAFVRGLDFSQPEEAEKLVSTFMEKTSGGKIKGIFQNVNSSANLLFATSFNFQGNWRTAFKPEKTSLQEFHVDEATTVMVPTMTRMGQFHYLNDKMRRCTVVKLSLSKRSYMLLVLPHEGVDLQQIESKLLTDVMSGWHESLQEGLLELSLPRFSVSSANDLRQLLANMNPEIEAKLLGSESDFNKLSDSQPFTIDQAVNKVIFEMSEEGAEPQVGAQEAGIPIKLWINRPFFFSVVEGDSNSMLVLGRIINPTL
ncbi:angiotensinogen [Synchiropus picturatus]